MLLVVGADVGEVEALGKVVVDLHSAELPFAADHVLDHEVDLRSVECGFAGFFDIVDIECLCGFAQRRFGLIPLGGIADVFSRIGIAQADAHAIVAHAEGVEHQLDQIEAAFDFLADLIFGAEQVGVVLSEAAHACQAVELAGLLPAIHGAKLGKAHRQVAVGVRLAVENFDVHRAVHRLEQIAVDLARIELIGELAAGATFSREALDRAGIDDRRKLRVLVIREVAGCAVQAELADVWGKDLIVVRHAQFFGDEVLQFLADDGAIRCPQRQARADGFVDVEQLEFLAQLAVVAGFGLLEALEVFSQLELCWERRCRRCAAAADYFRRHGDRRQRWRVA